MMFRSILTACLLVILASGCKGKEDEELPAVDADQIAAAKKKAAERKAKKAKAGDKDADDKTTAKAGDKGKTKAGDKGKTKAGDDTAAKKDPNAAKAGDTTATRAEKRKKRLADLKKRSEERRKERLDRLKKRKTAADEARAGAAGAGKPKVVPARANVVEADPKDPKAVKAAKAAAKRAGDKSMLAPRAKAGNRPDPKAAALAARDAAAAASRAPQAAALGTPVNALKISKYMTLADVREVTGKSNIVDAGPLVGIPASASYNATLYTLGKADFAASIQVWKEVTQRAADQRFRRMQKDYPNAEDTDAVSAKGFFSAWNNMMTLVFFEPFKRTLVAVTCSDKVCSQASLLALAKRVKSQM